MVTKTYLTSNLCDSSDSSDTSESCDSNDSSDSSDRSDSTDSTDPKKCVIQKKYFTKNIFSSKRPKLL